MRDTLEAEIRATGLTVRYAVLSMTDRFNQAMLAIEKAALAIEKAAHRWEEQAAGEALTANTGEGLTGSDAHELARDTEEPGERPD